MASAVKILTCSMTLKLEACLMSVGGTRWVDSLAQAEALPETLTHFIYSQMLASLSICTSSSTMLLHT